MYGSPLLFCASIIPCSAVDVKSSQSMDVHSDFEVAFVHYYHPSIQFKVGKYKLA
ncbi:uncharacterized protein RAG0_11868 [Rhynchosporium agropyri]|uniref:Uncharacterized protein n=1 Tax=Rhynchosporium agropyri TaxID=914238 RepID=A0A1E1L6A7_9HELO|nr:uncharacterized protein RAG0_11868 [Rhynchosporium agropyri]